MPYMKVERDDGVCVHKRGDDGQPEGEALGCHDTEAEANAQIAAIEASEAKAAKRRRQRGTKASRFAGRVDHVLASLRERGAASPVTAQALAGRLFKVYKQGDGRSRWVLFSSNAYEDRDGQIVSQAALEADVARADADGIYGPLRWWHLGAPDASDKQAPWGPGIDLGDCDYNAMQGRILVESGTFRDERVAAAVLEHADELGASIGFWHPVDQPDDEGVFHDIARFERSLLPAEYASNPLTMLAAVHQEEDSMLKTKLQQLFNLLGDDKLAEAVIESAGVLDESAEKAGVRHKEASQGEQPAVKEEGSLDDRVMQVRNAVGALNPAGGSYVYWAMEVFEDRVMVERQLEGATTFWAAGYSIDGEGVVTIAAPETWTEVERTWAPVSASAAASEGESEAAGEGEAEKAAEGESDEDEKQKGESEGDGEEDDEQPDPEITGMKLSELVGVIHKTIEPMLVPLSEKLAAFDAALAERGEKETQASSQVEQVSTQVKGLAEMVEVLIGDAPRSVARAARASQSDKSRIEEQSAEVKERLAAAAPKPDEAVPFGAIIGHLGMAEPAASPVKLAPGEHAPA